MELCSEGDLGKLLKDLKDSGRNLNEQTIWNIFFQMCQAIKICHSREQRMIHRDLKPSNIFLDENMTVKLGDFGLSKVMTGSVFATTHVGTPYYMAPELIEDQTYNEKIDIWAIGCILYEMCAKSPPFSAKNILQLAMKIKRGKIRRIPSQYSDNL